MTTEPIAGPPDDLPVISVITVVLNAERHLAPTIESIIGQSYPKLEYIVVDGGSSDGTFEIIEHYRQFVSTLVREPDKGIYDAMNKGLRLARGELIAILNAGDRYLPGALHALAEEARRFPESGIFYGDTLVEQDDAEISFVVPGAMQHRRGMGFHHPAMFARKRVYDAVGDYDLSYSLASDYDFVLRAVQAGVTFRHIDMVSASYLNSGESYRNQRKTLGEIRTINRRRFGQLSGAHLECLWSSTWSMTLMILEQVIRFMFGEKTLRRLKQIYVRKVLEKNGTP